MSSQVPIATREPSPVLALEVPGKRTLARLGNAFFNDWPLSAGVQHNNPKFGSRTLTSRMGFKLLDGRHDSSNFTVFPILIMTSQNYSSIPSDQVFATCPLIQQLIVIVTPSSWP
jgi:hypothetical protein